ncbi:MAG: 5-(carboxyamino)imidazole ribonucleotide synthase [Planctomycetaceae bacterium]|nr:5-(carboxyamino)imidazole ribonucleotide synthase [Planctomycetaceae bacterium]
MGESSGRAVVGVVGGGQLCLMLAEETRRKGLPYDLIAVDPTPDSPARPFLKDQILADFKDHDAIVRMAERADYVTFEIEQANSATLEGLEKSWKIVHPSPATLRTIQDKLVQKTFLRSKGLPVPDFKPIGGKDELLAALKEFGCPALLKARTDSYDGRGNRVISKPEEADEALAAFNGRPLMLERFVDFAMEVSVIAARSTSGEIRTYPLGENIHADNILQMTVVPARVEAATVTAAEDVARETLKALQGAGVFGIEMFVDRKGGILINEIAPRVHNSGHYTIEACRTSQFEQHIRAITGMPLGDTSLLYSAVMVNLLGAPDIKGPYAWEGVDAVRQIPGVHVHLYGKKESAPKRKLGHVTLVGVNDPAFREALIHRAEHVRRMLVQKAGKR